MPNSRPTRRTTDSGRVPFVWVRDPDTGHAYDVAQNAIPASVTPVEGYPLNYSGTARRTKYFVDKDGSPATPAMAASSLPPPAPDANPTELDGAAASTSRKAVK